MTDEVAQQAAQAADQNQAATEAVLDGAQTGELQNQQDVANAETQTAAEPAKPEPKVEKRFSELTRAQKEAERRAQEAERRLERLLDVVERTNKSPESEHKPTPQIDAEPQPPEFIDPAQYQRDMAEYTRQMAAHIAKKELQAQRETEQKQRMEQTQREYQDHVRQQYAERRAAAVEKYADYEEVAEREDVIVSQPMAHAIAMSEHGPDIAYHFGKNPKEAERIAAMTIPTPMGPMPDIARQMYEIGLLAAKLASPKPVTTKAPAPIAPIKGGAAPSSKSDDEMSMDEYAAKHSGRGR